MGALDHDTHVHDDRTESEEPVPDSGGTREDMSLRGAMVRWTGGKSEGGTSEGGESEGRKERGGVDARNRTCTCTYVNT
jgi:hypothetical protein